MVMGIAPISPRAIARLRSAENKRSGERDTRFELATFGLGKARAIAGIVGKNGVSGQLRTVCLEMLIAVSTGNEPRTREALAALRAALVDALDVTAAVALAGELLATDDGRAAGGAAA
jgi:hypothetical protein